MSAAMAYRMEGATGPAADAASVAAARRQARSAGGPAAAAMLPLLLHLPRQEGLLLLLLLQLLLRAERGLVECLQLLLLLQLLPPRGLGAWEWVWSSRIFDSYYSSWNRRFPKSSIFLHIRLMSVGYE